MSLYTHTFDTPLTFIHMNAHINAYKDQVFIIFIGDRYFL